MSLIKKIFLLSTFILIISLSKTFAEDLKKGRNNIPAVINNIFFVFNFEIKFKFKNKNIGNNDEKIKYIILKNKSSLNKLYKTANRK